MVSVPLEHAMPNPPEFMPGQLLIIVPEPEVARASPAIAPRIPKPTIANIAASDDESLGTVLGSKPNQIVEIGLQIRFCVSESRYGGIDEPFVLVKR